MIKINKMIINNEKIKTNKFIICYFYIMIGFTYSYAIQFVEFCKLQFVFVYSFL